MDWATILAMVLGAISGTITIVDVVVKVIAWTWRRLSHSPKMSIEELRAEIRRDQWLAEMRIRRDVLTLVSRFRHVGIRLNVGTAGVTDAGSRFKLRDAADLESPPAAPQRPPWWRRWWRLWSGPEDDRPRRPSLPPHG